MKDFCSYGDCIRDAAVKGMCSAHYKASWKKHVREHGKIGIATGEDHWSWKGGRRITGYGYVELTGGRLEHRVVMEQMIGRPLLKGEEVHHINGDRQDNRPENLELWVHSQPAGVRIPDLIARYLPLEDPPMWAVMC